MYYDDDDDEDGFFLFFCLFLFVSSFFVSSFPFLSAFGFVKTLSKTVVCCRHFLFVTSKIVLQNCNNNNNNNNNNNDKRRRDDFQLGRVDGVLPVRVFVSGTRFDTRADTNARFLYIFTFARSHSPLCLSPRTHAQFSIASRNEQLFLRRNNTNT